MSYTAPHTSSIHGLHAVEDSSIRRLLGPEEEKARRSFETSETARSTKQTGIFTTTTGTLKSRMNDMLLF
jgi:hypothetical protein